MTVTSTQGIPTFLSSVCMQSQFNTIQLFMGFGDLYSSLQKLQTERVGTCLLRTRPLIDDQSALNSEQDKLSKQRHGAKLICNRQLVSRGKNLWLQLEIIAWLCLKWKAHCFKKSKRFREKNLLLLLWSISKVWDMSQHCTGGCLVSSVAIWLHYIAFWEAVRNIFHDFLQTKQCFKQ